MVSRQPLTTALLSAVVAFGAPAHAAQQTASRISIATGGTQANGPSSFASASANGRFVVFSFDATDLVPGATNSTDEGRTRNRRVEIALLRGSAPEGGPVVP